MKRDFLYCARRVGDRVVRLAIPSTGVRRSERLAWTGVAVAGVLGAFVVMLVFVLTRRLTGRLDEQEKRLEVAAANETFRREFTANVTHELKSPLTAILGAVEMLGDGSQLSEKERADLLGIITAERLRFDFSWPEKMTEEQKAAVEKLVNEWIDQGIEVTKKMTTVEEAKAEGAMALFGAKYGDQVSLYSIGDISKEICCGPHVTNTKELGSFKIKKEESSSAGVRRIKAVIGNLA